MYIMHVLRIYVYAILYIINVHLYISFFDTIIIQELLSMDNEKKYLRLNIYQKNISRT